MPFMFPIILEKTEELGLGLELGGLQEQETGKAKNQANKLTTSRNSSNLKKKDKKHHQQSSGNLKKKKKSGLLIPTFKEKYFDRI